MINKWFKRMIKEAWDEQLERHNQVPQVISGAGLSADEWLTISCISNAWIITIGFNGNKPRNGTNLSYAFTDLQELTKFIEGRLVANKLSV